MMLEAKGVTVRYGAQEALRGISFTVREGDWLMLAGPNGAGKSTLIRALSQSCPYEGSFTLNGTDLRKLSPAARAGEIGILSQHNSAQYAYTVGEIVRLGRYAHQRGFLARRNAGDDSAVEAALAATGISALRGKSILTLSGGELQRVFLAQVFAQDPHLMVLDEPANHLDLKYQQHIFGLIGEWLQEPGRAVISVIHDLSLAKKYGTRALLLSHGDPECIGPVDQVLSREHLQRVYEMDVYGWMRGLSSAWND